MCIWPSGTISIYICTCRVKVCACVCVLGMYNVRELSLNCCYLMCGSLAHLVRYCNNNTQMFKEMIAVVHWSVLWSFMNMLTINWKGNSFSMYAYCHTLMRHSWQYTHRKLCKTCILRSPQGRALSNGSEYRVVVLGIFPCSQMFTDVISELPMDDLPLGLVVWFSYCHGCEFEL